MKTPGPPVHDQTSHGSPLDAPLGRPSLPRFGAEEKGLQIIGRRAKLYLRALPLLHPNAADLTCQLKSHKGPRGNCVHCNYCIDCVDCIDYVNWPWKARSVGKHATRTRTHTHGPDAANKGRCSRLKGRGNATRSVCSECSSKSKQNEFNAFTLEHPAAERGGDRAPLPESQSNRRVII